MREMDRGLDAGGNRTPTPRRNRILSPARLNSAVRLVRCGSLCWRSRFRGFGLLGGGRGNGNVGWFPLGPRKYMCGYHTSREYVNRVNVSNTTVTNITITNVYNSSNTNIRYANREVRGGVTAVPQGSLCERSASGSSRGHRELEGGCLRSGRSQAAVAPTRNSTFSEMLRWKPGR